MVIDGTEEDSGAILAEVIEVALAVPPLALVAEDSGELLREWVGLRLVLAGAVLVDLPADSVAALVDLPVVLEVVTEKADLAR